MAKKLFVKSPQTVDGKTPQFDDDNRQVYKESYMEPAARQTLESINSKLPKNLQHIITEVDVQFDEKGNIPTAKAETAKKQDESKTDEHLTAAEVIEQISKATTKKEVKDLAKGDERKTVQDAAEKKLSELEK